MFEKPHNAHEDAEQKARHLSNQIIDRFDEQDPSTWITDAEAQELEAAGDPMGILENEKVAGRYPRPEPHSDEEEFKKAA